MPQVDAALVPPEAAPVASAAAAASSAATTPARHWRHTLQQRWEAMAERERLLVTLATAVVGMALLWWVGLAPALRTLRQAPAQIESLDQQLQQMRNLATEVRGLRAVAPMPTAQAQAALSAAAQRLGDKARLALQGERAVLQINRIGGEELAAWLAEVRGTARARALEAQLTRTPQGDYSGSLVLALGVRP